MSELESIKSVSGRAFQMIANHAYPNGSTVRCIPCGKQRSCTTSEIAEWMQSGFPRCRKCNHPVDLINPWLRESQ